MATFTHLDPGTAESVWQDDARWAAVPALDTRIDQLIVVAAHPDDETLGVGALMHRVHGARGRVTVIVASDGEASHPDSPTHSPTDIAGLRRVEVIRAIHVLAPGAPVHFLGLPDGGLRENADSLAASIDSIVESLAVDPARTLIVAPWSGDGHRDHRVTAECVGRVCGPRGLRHLGYPIWLWHWGIPDDVPWSIAHAVSATAGERAVKGRALDAYESQIRALSDAPGDEPVLSEDMRAHFVRDGELFFTEARNDASTLPAAYFEAVYARHDDPWGFASRWYERRKRGILRASLPGRALGSVLEIGCSTGLITAALAERADHVLAMDVSAAALESARSLLGDEPGVTLRLGAVPGDWPDGRFDTIVLSEVGYYLSMGDLQRTIELIDASLTDSGCLVACHWRHDVAAYPQSGDDVHRALRGYHGWGTLARHEEEDFVLEVFARRPVASVARREGLV